VLFLSISITVSLSKSVVLIMIFVKATLLSYWICSTTAVLVQNYSSALPITISSDRQAYLTESYVALAYSIPVLELEAVTTTLRFSLGSLKNAHEFSYYLPLKTTIGSSNITLFQRKMPLYLASRLCNTEGLTPLNIDNLPKDASFRQGILLQTEMAVGEAESLFCVGPSVTSLGDDCFQAISHHVSHLQFYKTKKDLVAALSAAKGKVHYLGVNSTHFYLTRSNVGFSGCIEKGNITHTTPQNDLHPLYYEKLYQSFERFIDAIESQVNKISDIAHQLSISSIHPPMISSSLEVTPESVLNLLPQYLVNHHNPINQFPDFQQFFRDTVNVSRDDVISRFTDTMVLKGLPVKTRLQLSGVYKQFMLGLKYRLTTLIKELDPEAKPDIPNTVLFKPDQTASSFIFFMMTLITDIEEDSLVEVYLIITNKKISLLRDIAELEHLDLSLPFLSRADFHSYRRGQLLKSSLPSEVPKVEPKASKTTTRKKRSAWGKFWSNILEVASSEDVTRVQIIESQNSANEFSMQTALSKLSRTNFDLKNSMQDMANTVGNLTTQQQTMFNQIHSVVERFGGTLTFYSSLAQSHQQAVYLSSEYSSLHLQVLLTLDTMQKAQTLLLTAISGIADPTQIEIRALHRSLQDNLDLSLRHVKTDIIFTEHGYSLKYFIPKYSEPYTVYNIDQLPLYATDHWYILTNLLPSIAMNHHHDYIATTEILSQCELRLDNYFCPAHSVTIRKGSNLTCTIQAISTFTSGAPDLSACKADKVLLTKEQKYLLTDDKLFIASPVLDSLIIDCPFSSNASDSVPLEIGLNLINRNPLCHYETSQLIIPNYQPVFTSIQYDSSSSLNELNLVSDLSDSKTLLERGIDIDYTPFNDIQRVLNVFQDDLTANLKTISELHEEAVRINQIDTLNNFSPLDLSSFAQNVKSDGSLGVVDWLNIVYYILIALGLGALILVCKNFLPDGCCFMTIKCLRSLFRSLFKSRPMRLRATEPSVSFNAHAHHEESQIELSNLESQRLQYERSFQSPPWKFTKDDKDQLVMTQTVSPGLELTYDLNYNMAVDHSNRRFPKIEKPSEGLIALYLIQVDNTPLPPLARDDSGLICLRDHSTIHYTNHSGWMDSTSQQKLWGFRKPLPEDC
jgi:hypothetical protein